MVSLNDLKTIFNNDGVQTYQARLVRTVRDSITPDLKQVTMGVVGITKDQHEALEGWERLDCDIIIIPRQSYKCAESIENMRLDQATMSLSDDDVWKKRKKSK